MAWTVVDDLDAGQRAGVDALVFSIEATTGQEALTEDHRDRVAARDDVRHALRGEPPLLDGYAVLASSGDTVEVEAAYGTFDWALADLLESFAGPVDLLLRGVDHEVEAGLVARGWHETRALVRMVRPLPADPSPAHALTVRAFRPGIDDEAWLAQNNASFAGHPTQGSMTDARLQARMRASWFDPAGFLLIFDAAALVASCWTKVRASSTGDVGEIYVVSVAPGAQGRGLGRLAVLLGLDSLARRGLRTAELYTEEDNATARTLYESLGFTVAARVVSVRFG